MTFDAPEAPGGPRLDYISHRKGNVNSDEILHLKLSLPLSTP